MKNIIIIIIILGVCGCKDKCIKEYTLQLPFSLAPQLDTFRIGDTIWLASNFSKEIMELNYNEDITLEDFKFNSELTIEKISSEPFENANLDFTVIDKLGSLNLIQLVGTTTFKITYAYEDNTYKTKFGFIPVDRGLFTLILSTYISDDLSLSIASSPNCKEKIESIEYLLNGGENNNYEFIQLSADSLIRTTSKEVYDMFGQYTFFVKK